VYNVIVVYKAVLFDLDGTLLDTLQDIADATNAALGTLRFPGHDIQAYRYFVGEGMATLAFKALPELCHNPDTVSQLLSVIDKEYAMRWAVHTVPYPGILELLDALVAKEIKMAVLSNKPHEFTIASVVRLLPHWHFDAVIGASGAMPRKPDPAGALAISKELRMSPVEFLYLGDTDIDMYTATAAGMYPVGALWGFRTANELLAGGARTLVQYPTDLLALLS
jgi:phosphoglycolate phosphatase